MHWSLYTPADSLLFFLFGFCKCIIALKKTPISCKDHLRLWCFIPSKILIEVCDTDVCIPKDSERDSLSPQKQWVFNAWALKCKHKEAIGSKHQQLICHGINSMGEILHCPFRHPSEPHFVVMVKVKGFLVRSFVGMVAEKGSLLRPVVGMGYKCKGLSWGPLWDWTIWERGMIYRHNGLSWGPLWRWIIWTGAFLKSFVGTGYVNQGLSWGPLWEWVTGARVLS